MHKIGYSATLDMFFIIRFKGGNELRDLLFKSWVKLDGQFAEPQEVFTLKPVNIDIPYHMT